jgi:hypothetical protein
MHSLDRKTGNGSTHIWASYPTRQQQLAFHQSSTVGEMYQSHIVQNLLADASTFCTITDEHLVNGNALILT